MKRIVTVLLTISFSATTHAAAWYEDWSAKPAWPEPISFFSGTALTLTTLAFRKKMIDELQHDQNTRKPLGNWSEAGDLYGQMIPNVIYTGGMIAAHHWGQNGLAASRAQLMIMASGEAVLISTVAKFIVREKRPDSNQRTSFPSGHSTSAFAFASVVGAVHGWTWGVPAYAMAAFTGWSRINDNKHFLNDIVAGATIGISTGLGVYYAQKKRLEGKEAAFMILPYPVEEGAGLSLQAHW